MMKQYKLLAIWLFFISTLYGCEDYLDKSPDMGLDAEDVYSDYYSFKGAVDRAVGLLHNYVYDRYDYGGEIGALSDEGQQVSIGHAVVTRINKGDWYDLNAGGFRFSMGNGNSGVGLSGGSVNEFSNRHEHREVAAEASVGIRACNLILENADLLKKFPEESEYTPEELKNQLIGQAYFLRGWFYFMLIRDYGGMPNMQKSFSTDQNFDVLRPEYLESNKWVVQDLDSAIHYLPENWNLTLNKDAGRVTKTSAKAVKAMALLYASSPNYNITRAQSLNFNGVPEYNLEVAQTAINANISALESALSSSNRYHMYSEEEYSENFYRKGTNGISDEAIFQPNVSNMSVTRQGSDTGVAWYISHFDGGWDNYIVPTQNAVEWFETSDGYKIDDAAGNSVTWNEADPYSNRDPRLKKFIFCHGDKMLTKKAKSFRGGLSAFLESDQPNGDHYSYVTGNGRFFTGYFYAGKHRWPGNNKADNENGYVRIFPFIRFVQLYLDFAELANELYGPTVVVPGSENIGSLSAVDAINIVRNRVGMPDVHAMYYSDKETFRNYIREERARELYSEQHRWWDLKRWRIAHEVLPQGIYGAYITENGSGGFNYDKQKIADRVFENKHYWYPFPSSTINMMNKFEQNPGW